ncbi:hypothetical protein ACO0KY_03135 [Undibacterium sp. Dicai25W]|uniref:hypothetical protein n=1 Tax=Undibacterium sp. Dicai25W TaxID=3413034 RepID=UPI003BF24726
MRFEVIKRDVEIDYWKAIAEGGDPEKLRQQRDQAITAIDDDFAFVIDCNVGGEFMSEEKIERLDNIAERKWQSSLSDRIGISSLKKERKDQTPEPLLPVMEKLLDDKPEHIFIREEQDKIAPDNPWGFNIKVPEHLYTFI